MAISTKVVAKPELARYLIEKFNQRRAQHKGRFYSQNSYAAEEIGMIPQTFSRYASVYNEQTGQYTADEITMSMDQAAILLSFYGLEIVPHFVYGRESSMTYTQAVSIAITAHDQDIAKTLEALAQMPADQRQAVSAAILRLAQGEEKKNTTAVLA